MFNTNPALMRKGVFACVALCMIFGGLFVMRAPVLIWLYLPSGVVLLGYALKVVYVNERFTEYARFCLIGFFAALTLMSMQSAYGVAKNSGWGVQVCACFSLLPLMIYAGAYIMISNAKSKSFPFKVEGGCVSTTTLKVETYSSLIAGVSVLVTGVWLKSTDQATTSMIVLIASVVFTLFLLHYYREVFRGLRLLKSQEKQSGVFYSFVNADEVREARRGWWLGRLIAGARK